VYVDTNIKGTLNVLQAARELNIEKVIHTSTSEIYGTAQFVPITEDHPVNPQSPYAATKTGADFLSLTFYKSFALPVTIVRPFNTYGPRQSARAIIPTIISQILQKQKTLKLGALHPTRDLNYVMDTVNGFIKAAESDQASGEVINIGSNKEISMRDLVEKISSIMQADIQLTEDQARIRPEKSEVERLWADNTKALKLLNWKPEYSLEKGIQETVSWFSNTDNLRMYKSHIYNI
jgi:nucleoside-diphosphate-sugar epimerase